MKAADGDLLCIVTGKWWRKIRRLGGSYDSAVGFSAGLH